MARNDCMWAAPLSMAVSSLSMSTPSVCSSLVLALLTDNASLSPSNSAAPAAASSLASSRSFFVSSKSWLALTRRASLSCTSVAEASLLLLRASSHER